MARVSLKIGGNEWPVSCRDGEEPQLLKLGAMIEERWGEARRAAGDAGATRIMLMAALMLADDLADAQAAATGATDEAALDRVADRLEALAATLEESFANA